LNDSPYRQLATRLNELPNGFPPAPDGAELRLLAYLFTPEEALLAAQLRLTLETPRFGAHRRDARPASSSRAWSRVALSRRARTHGRIGYGLLPFVVGICEMQAGRIDGTGASIRGFLSADVSPISAAAAAHPSRDSVKRYPAESQFHPLSAPILS
jgi:hypothetical protein